jgi:phage tail sheath protein FI
MPQYLSPGVYTEEVNFGSGTIEGVSTSTAGFVGATRYGPISGTPYPLTCLSDYVAIYGSIDPIFYGDVNAGSPTINFLGQAVRAFFDNGGSLCYVSRVWNPEQAVVSPPENYGYAWTTLTGAGHTLSWTGRYPGAAGNVTLTLTFSIGQNVLISTASGPTVRGVNSFDIVWVSPVSTSGNPGANGAFYCAESRLNTVTGGTAWSFRDAANTLHDISNYTAGQYEARVFTASLQIAYPDGAGRADFYPGLTFDPRSATSLASTFPQVLSDSYYRLTRPVIFNFTDTSPTAGIEIAQLLLAQATASSASMSSFSPPTPYPVNISNMIQGKVTQVQYIEQLQHGQDGFWPTSTQYQGTEDPSNPLNKTGLYALEDLSNVSIVAVPGSTYNAGSNGSAAYLDAQETTNYLIAHCEKMLYRIAVLDAPNNQGISDISAWRGQFDSEYAALYYPWVRIIDPTNTTTVTEINLPPSGFVAGIYARSDSNEGVQKAPANEIVTDAIGFETMLNKGQQDVLNPQGVNCFRFFEGRGYRLWGARTVTSQAIWQYVNLRRYMNYLKQSIDQGTQDLVFQSNGPDLWASTQQRVSDFLSNEFANRRLLGATKTQAFFVRCDLTTMTQNDLDNGRLVCLIGVSLLRPAEFVIFRIGQFTASSSNSQT